MEVKSCGRSRETRRGSPQPTLGKYSVETRLQQNVGHGPPKLLIIRPLILLTTLHPDVLSLHTFCMIPGDTFSNVSLNSPHSFFWTCWPSALRTKSDVLDRKRKTFDQPIIKQEEGERGDPTEPLHIHSNTARVSLSHPPRHAL